MRDLVTPYLRFKLKVYYPEGSKYNSGTFYGEEWSCTLDQVIYKKVQTIELSRYSGYMDLVNMIENGYLTGKYTTALIYEHDGEDFNILCRKYSNGVLETETVCDPVFDESNSTMLLTPLFKQIPGTKDFKLEVVPIDFAQEVKEVLDNI